VTSLAVGSLCLSLAALVTPVQDGSKQDGQHPAPPRSKPSPQALADLIDRSLAQTWKEKKLEVAPGADDATWLRRLSLDLCGTIPERDEVAVFLAEEHADKRLKKIDEYLADRASAENFSYLWGNALLAGAQKGPEGVRLRPWLEEQFAKDTPFSEVARELVGASGRNDENGATSFVLAYNDEMEALAAVTARTLLGVQIQCAQCHDHPYDHWKQADFNGFAAFFLGARANRVAETPQAFRLTDATPEELRRKGPRSKDMTNGEEDEAAFQAFLAKLPAQQRERAEKNHQRLVKYSEPKYLGGDKYADTPLLPRRAALAEWIVDPENPWFAQAVVNRMWGHFFGKGLVDPVDDLTGSKDVVLPQLLGTIAQKFQESGTDVRYLVEAFARTRVYALANSTEREGERRDEQERWFAAHPLRPFTAEQVLHALTRATAMDEKVPRGRGEEFERNRMKLLEKFRYVFADDEGGDAERFASSIPQALFLMNGKQTNDEIELKRSKILDEILDESKSDRDRLKQVFYATLNRAPSQREAEKLGRMVKGAAGGGKKGIEDLYWALLNSTEFLTNH
jgi:hypothetical protein